MGRRLLKLWQSFLMFFITLVVTVGLFGGVLLFLSSGWAFFIDHDLKNALIRLVASIILGTVIMYFFGDN